MKIFVTILAMITCTFNLLLAVALLFHENLFLTSTAQILTLTGGLIVTTLASVGFIILFNQRSVAESLNTKANLDLIFTTSPDAVLITRMTDDCVVRINDGFTRLTGYTRANVIGKTSLEINLWENPADRHFLIAELNDKGYCDNLEAIFQCKDGSKLTGLVSAKIIPLKDGPYILAVTRNITERKMVEKALDESENKLQTIIKASPDGIVITRMDMTIQFATKRCISMWGYDSENELMGRDLIAFVHSSYQEKAISIISNLINGILTGPTEFLAVRKDGSLFFAEANAQLLRDARNNPFGILFILRDITKRKQAEDTMVKLTAMEERQRFARDLHDSVNQSIHGLVLLSETLISTLEKNNTERAKQIAGRLQENARQVLKETRLMLYEIQPPETELGTNLIENLETRLLTVERHAGVRARIIQEGSMEYCPRAWHENIFWITIEALNNAMKYAQASDIQIVIRCFPQNLELEVIDNGIGFDPGKSRGGLGLQSMRERASLLGGELTIISTAGEGSRVRFRAEVKEKL